MSRPEAVALLSLAESIADGAPIDWDAAEAGASERDRVLIGQLRVLSDLAGLHRSLPAVVCEPNGAAPKRHGLAAPAIGNWAHLTLLAARRRHLRRRLPGLGWPSRTGRRAQAAARGRIDRR